MVDPEGGVKLKAHQERTVNGNPWRDFDAAGEGVSLRGVRGTVRVECNF